jgi:phosphate acetyltransferase/phosphate butyryltransferase
MWGAAIISAVLGTELPGPGTIYLDQTLQFRHPIRVGDTVTVTLTVAEKFPENKRVNLDCKATNRKGEVMISGVATVIAPVEKITRPRIAIPEVDDPFLQGTRTAAPEKRPALRSSRASLARASG